jgi:hypothetical protein
MEDRDNVFLEGLERYEISIKDDIQAGLGSCQIDIRHNAILL